MLLMLLLASASIDGPVGKFDALKPSVDLTSARQMGEIERCLIDLPKQRVPMVYRQADKPDDVMIVWTVLDGQTAARVDLKKTAKGTQVRGWRAPERSNGCY